MSREDHGQDPQPSTLQPPCTRFERAAHYPARNTFQTTAIQIARPHVPKAMKPNPLLRAAGPEIIRRRCPVPRVIRCFLNPRSMPYATASNEVGRMRLKAIFPMLTRSLSMTSKDGSPFFEMRLTSPMAGCLIGSNKSRTCVLPDTSNGFGVVHLDLRRSTLLPNGPRISCGDFLTAHNPTFPLDLKRPPAA